MNISNRLNGWICGLVGIVFSLTVRAYDKLDVVQAHEHASKGEIVLVDIRNNWERKIFGTVAHSVVLPVDDQQFGAKLLELKQKNPEKLVALICATGGRTKALNQQLEKHNYQGFADVIGGQSAWKKNGLPAK